MVIFLSQWRGNVSRSHLKESMLVKDLSDAGDGPYCVARNTSAQFADEDLFASCAFGLPNAQRQNCRRSCGPDASRRLGVNYEYDSEN